MDLWNHFEDLLLLRVRLELTNSGSQVLMTLEQGVGRVLAEWSYSARDFDLPDTLTAQDTRGNGVQFRLPGDFPHQLKVQFFANTQLTPGKSTLWIHLQKPYGYLGLIPWEALLHPHLKTPILRLPSFYTPAPAELSDTLDVAICSSVPQAKGQFAASDYVRYAIEALEQASRPITVHVFVDQRVYDEFQNDPLPDFVNVPNPEESIDYGTAKQSRTVSSASTVDNPWLRWVSESLSGKSLDAVYFINHGYMSGESGAIAFAESPTRNQDRSWSRFIGGPQITRFMADVDAWCLMFTSPEPNFSEIGLRRLADYVAQRHPGPVVMHDMASDDQAQGLAATCRYLFGLPGEFPPASSPAMTVYASPALKYSTFGSDTVPIESYSPMIVGDLSGSRKLPDAQSPGLRTILSTRGEAPDTTPAISNQSLRGIESIIQSYYDEKSAAEGGM